MAVDREAVKAVHVTEQEGVAADAASRIRFHR